MILMLHTNMIMIVIIIFNYDNFDVAHKNEFDSFYYDNIDFDVANENDHV